MKENTLQSQKRPCKPDLAGTEIQSSGPVFRSYDDLPLTLKVEDLMPILGIGRNTAYELVRGGAIKSIRVGRQLRIPKQALIDYLGNYLQNGQN